MAAAPVRHAESGHAGVFGGGEGRQACPGALLRRLGSHSTDRGPRQGSPGPLLPDIRGANLKMLASIVRLDPTHDKIAADSIVVITEDLVAQCLFCN